MRTANICPECGQDHRKINRAQRCMDRIPNLLFGIRGQRRIDRMQKCIDKTKEGRQDKLLRELAIKCPSCKRTYYAFYTNGRHQAKKWEFKSESSACEICGSHGRIALICPNCKQEYEVESW